MVARHAEILLVALFFALCPAQAWSDRETADAAPGATSHIARHRLAESVVQVEQRMNVCRSRETVVPANRLSATGLDDQSLRLALQYFSIKADNECIADAAGRFVMAASMAERAGVMEDARERLRDDEMPENAEVEELVLYPMWQEIELQAQYRQLPEDARHKLEMIEQLHQPFDPIASAESAGLL